VSLTVGTSPLGRQPAGVFNFTLDPPGAAIYVEPLPYRVRALFEGETVVDARRPLLLHESGHLPVFYFAAADVRLDLLEASAHTTHCPYKGNASYWSLRVGDRVAPDAVWSYEHPFESVPWLAGHYALRWLAIDEWFAEEEQILGHPKDPYARIDVLRSSRHVRVLVGDEVVADTRQARMLCETGLPPRYYIPVGDVRTDLLVPSSHRSRCAYKGSASYWSVRTGDRTVEDLVWAYLAPEHDAAPVQGMLCFFNERVEIELDGERIEQPQTQWSRQSEETRGDAQMLRGLLRPGASGDDDRAG